MKSTSNVTIVLGTTLAMVLGAASWATAQPNSRSRSTTTTSFSDSSTVVRDDFEQGLSPQWDGSRGNLEVVSDPSLFGESLLRIMVTNATRTEGDDEKVCKKIPTPPRLNVGFALDLSNLSGDGYTVDILAMGGVPPITQLIQDPWQPEVRVTAEMLPSGQAALGGVVRGGDTVLTIPTSSLGSREVPYFVRLSWQAADSAESFDGFLRLEVFALFDIGALLLMDEEIPGLDNWQPVLDEIRLGWLGGAGAFLESPGYFQVDEVTIRKEGSIRVPRLP